MEHMKLILSVIVLAIILLPISLAGTSSIFSDYIADEETVRIDDYDFTAHFYRDYDVQYKYNETVRLSSPFYGSFILQKDSSFVKEPYTFYYSDDVEADGTTHYYISITKQLPALGIERTLTSTNKTPRLGDLVSVAVRIVNQGAHTITVRYAENLTKEVKIIGYPEVNVHNTTWTDKETPADLYWSGVLYKGETATLSYTMEIVDYPKEGNNITFSDFSVSYKDAFTRYEDVIAPLSFLLEDPLVILFETPTQDPTIGQERLSTLILVNTADKEIIVENMNLHIPQGILMTAEEKEFSPIDEDDYSWSGAINSGHNTSFRFSLTPTYLGRHIISFNATYREGHEEIRQQTLYEEAYYLDALNLTPNIRFDALRFTGGNNVTITFMVTNNDSAAHFVDEHVLISSPLFADAHYILSFPAKKIKYIAQEIVQLPYSDREISYPIFMNITSGGVWHGINRTLTVRPDEQPFPFSFNYTVAEVNDSTITLLLSLTPVSPLSTTPLESLSVSHRIDTYEEGLVFSEDMLSSLQKGLWESTLILPHSIIMEERIGLDVDVAYVIANNTHYTSFAQLLYAPKASPPPSNIGSPASLPKDETEELNMQEDIISHEVLNITKHLSIPPAPISLVQYTLLAIISFFFCSILILRYWRSH
jgi:hypothetical protein